MPATTSCSTSTKPRKLLSWHCACIMDHSITRFTTKILFCKSKPTAANYRAITVCAFKRWTWSGGAWLLRAQWGSGCTYGNGNLLGVPVRHRVLLRKTISAEAHPLKHVAPRGGLFKVQKDSLTSSLTSSTQVVPGGGVAPPIDTRRVEGLPAVPSGPRMSVESEICPGPEATTGKSLPPPRAFTPAFCARVLLSTDATSCAETRVGGARACAGVWAFSRAAASPRALELPEGSACPCHPPPPPH